MKYWIARIVVFCWSTAAATFLFHDYLNVKSWVDAVLFSPVCACVPWGIYAIGESINKSDNL